MTAAARLDDAAIAGADLVRKPVRLEDLVERVRASVGPTDFDSAPKTVSDNAPTHVDDEGSNPHKGQN